MLFTFADLFAGIGGFHAAMAKHGGKPVFISEIDAHARQVYAKNWLSGDDSKIGGDIKLLTEGVKMSVPKHNVLTGGFPCQPFSKSGNQHGVQEARGTLFYNILKIIEKRKPELILLENVKNLIGPKHLGDYKVMIRLIRELGYVVSDHPTILSPHEVPEKFGGTPQHRERVFIGAVRMTPKIAETLRELPPLLPRSPFKVYGDLKWDLQTFLDKKTLNNNKELGTALSSEQLKALSIWNNFLKLNRKYNKSQLPGLPLWTEFWKMRKPANLDNAPGWKVQFIEKNREFYLNNRNWIDPWREDSKLTELIPSYRKFEWQARGHQDIFECLIQFRPSGIRVKLPNYVPTFVALAQTPVVGWKSRHLTLDEAKVLQGFDKNFDFMGQRTNLSFKQIGNAVHVGVASVVFQSLLLRAIELGQSWASELTVSNSLMCEIPVQPFLR